MPSFENGSRLEQLTEGIRELQSATLTIADYDNAFFAYATHKREPYEENVLQMQLLNRTVNFITNCQPRSQLSESFLFPCELFFPLFNHGVTICARMAHDPKYCYRFVPAFQNCLADSLGFELVIQIAQRLLAD